MQNVVKGCGGQNVRPGESVGERLGQVRVQAPFDGRPILGLCFGVLGEHQLLIPYESEGFPKYCFVIHQ
jgi:hypothetical protein